MLSTLKGKVTFGAVLIITILAVVLNILISKLLIKNLENTILKEMNCARITAVNDIKNYSKFTNAGKLQNSDSWELVNSISNVFRTYTALAFKEDLISYSGKIVNNESIINIIKSSKESKSILNLDYNGYNGNALEATYSYPVYIDGNFYATLIFQKEYSELYKNYRRFIFIAILIEISMFVLLIILLYLLVDRTTKPLSYLSQAMKNVAEGNYDIEISLKTGDEIEELGESFNFMKSKIKEQLNSINCEKEKVENLERYTREFFNNATHEMKTPITAISGYAQLLKENDLDENISTRAIDRIEIESRRMNKLVCNLLDLSKGKLQIYKKKEIFDLSEMVNKCIDELSIKGYNHDMKFISQILPISAYGVKEEIKQVITNVLDNAIKYSNGEYLKVVGYECDNFSVLEFSNSCNEIPKDIKNRLLEPFIKYNYNSISISSSGLGLYICKNIMEQNGGEITYLLKNQSIIFTVKVLKS